MRAAKRWLRSPRSLGFACWLIAVYARLIWYCGRWQIEGREHLLRLHEKGTPTLAAFWHGRILVMPFAWHGRAPFHMLISSHIDGRLIGGAVKHFGIEWIAGSSTDGAGAAVLPVSYATRWRRILGSWDRFHLPLPFSRGVMIYGEPVEVANDSDEAAAEACRALVEQRLNAITAEADRRMGHEALAPGTMNRAALRALKRAEQGR